MSNVWDFLEKPCTSTAAGGYAVASLGVTLVSNVTFIMSTLDKLQTYIEVMMITDLVNSITIFIFSLEYIIRWNSFDDIFIVYIARFTCSPRNIKFFLQPMNLLYFALVPIYVSFTFFLPGGL